MFLLLYFAFAYYCFHVRTHELLLHMMITTKHRQYVLSQTTRKYFIPFGVFHMVTNVKLVIYMRQSDRQWLSHVFGNKPYYQPMLIDHKAKSSHIINRQSHENQYYVSFTR